MPHLCWKNYFLECQGYNVYSTIMYQDNQSAIILENNGRATSSNRTKYPNIRYFFITDRIKKGDLHIEYCPTDNMLADFFTKPLQGKKFLQFRKLIINLQDWNLPWPKECVGNKLLSFYLNFPMFGFQSHLLPVLFRIHEWIICCPRLIILPSLFDILLRLPSIYRIVCLQSRDNYSQLLYNLIHLYSVY